MPSMQLEDVADSLVACAQAGDLAKLRTICVPDVALWHNTTLVELRGEAAFKALEFVVAIPDLKYAEIRRHFWEDGFVSQHVVTGRKPDGTVFRLPVCYVVTVREGRIARLEEWWDSAANPFN